MKHIPPLTISSAIPGSHCELYISFSPFSKSNNESDLHPLRNSVGGFLESNSHPCMIDKSTILHRLHNCRLCIATMVPQTPSFVCQSLSCCYYYAIKGVWVLCRLANQIAGTGACG